MNQHYVGIGLFGCLVLASGCAHTKTATVLPKGANQFEIIGQSSTEQQAYSNAENEGKYTCEHQDKQMIVKDQQSKYQGADKEKKGDVAVENVALAFVTGSSGKERNVDDYKVMLKIQCQ